ncbi:hypothetical protein BD324DRAFT_364388 [Kockovaella imperatae]|uniref:Uncharacterized protein n=1 Tax=Kockovaella imperatae TaxID=4999 RepID=A0A1Y1UKE7_9TREE|nr:hypothetical protein BD324DRAFT_364388 [Kockovaella imperatae]ORX38530.1 hypothetical protein BD324DRAFT_364388 [Kockovaella imperatae]
MHSAMLIRELQTDLSPFGEHQLETARTQWIHELTLRMDFLNDALANTACDMDYGGPINSAKDIEPLEEAVDEARRMVCALGGEMRRRSEGELLVWMMEPLPEGVIGRRGSTA